MHSHKIFFRHLIEIFFTYNKNDGQRGIEIFAKYA